MTALSNFLIETTAKLRDALRPYVGKLGDLIVYNPLEYTWEMHKAYLERFGRTPKRVVFIGMNPGPFGMAQTGVPFGQIAAVRDWLKLNKPIGRPAVEHPKRPIEGFSCKRSEVSGQRLWGLFAQRFGQAEVFFEDHLILNYCPLVFIEPSGRNITPETLPTPLKKELAALCGPALKEMILAVKPTWVIGIGNFAYDRALELVGDCDYRFGKILHPSPASPASRKDWAKKVTQTLEDLGVWSPN